MLQPRHDCALNEEELTRVVQLIRPGFDKYVEQFDETKYPPEIYDRLLRVFAEPDRATDGDIRNAIIWKFGHWGRSRIPSLHESLILKFQQQWPRFSVVLAGSASELIARLDAVVGGPYRFTTLAFILHLLRPSEAPIIDRFNFRAMNYCFEQVRPGRRSKLKPSKLADVATLSAFMRGIRSCWNQEGLTAAPSERKLDQFLMMFGKTLSAQQRALRPKIDLQDVISKSDEADSRDLKMWINLPHGGSNAGFEVGKLIEYLDSLGRDYIIQGQVNCVLATHPKPQSLDACYAKISRTIQT